MIATDYHRVHRTFTPRQVSNHHQYSGHSIRMSRISVLSLQLSRRFQISHIIHIQLEMGIHFRLISLLPKHLCFQIIRKSFQSHFILLTTDFHILLCLFMRTFGKLRFQPGLTRLLAACINSSNIFSLTFSCSRRACSNFTLADFTLLVRSPK